MKSAGGRRSCGALSVFLSVMVLAASAVPFTAGAQEQKTGKHHRHCLHGNNCHKHSHVIYMHPAPASFVIDAASGQVLESENADAPRYPASLTKMMTLYLTFESLKKGALHLEQQVPVSSHAASQPQTNIALQSGDRISIRDAILSIVVRSANDSAVTLAEAQGGGSEEAFAHKMTEKARTLGMKHTFFHNASGLPDPEQQTTARDMAILGRALRKNYPQYFAFFRTESFSYHGQVYVTHNHVMTRYDGVDGIKTGYIRVSGFNVVTSANRGGHTLIAVVMGGRTARARDDKMIALLDHTFIDLASRDAKAGIRVASTPARSRMTALLPAKATYGGNEVVQGEGDEQEDSGKPETTSTTTPLQAPPLVQQQPTASAQAHYLVPPQK
jgi:D-alanyl-D-alanine carboxypeptidase